MGKEYYAWPDNTYITSAQAALDVLNTHPALPDKGQRNGEENEDASGFTTSWHTQVDEYTEGKIGFPRIPATRLDSLEERGYLGCDQASRDAYLATYITGTGGSIHDVDVHGPLTIPEE